LREVFRDLPQAKKRNSYFSCVVFYPLLHRHLSGAFRVCRFCSGDFLCRHRSGRYCPPLEGPWRQSALQGLGIPCSPPSVRAYQSGRIYQHCLGPAAEIRCGIAHSCGRYSSLPLLAQKIKKKSHLHLTCLFLFHFVQVNHSWNLSQKDVGAGKTMKLHLGFTITPLQPPEPPEEIK